MCRQVAKLAGALSVLTRHSSSRKTMSMTQCKEFSMAQCAQIIGPTTAASITSEVMYNTMSIAATPDCSASIWMGFPS